MNTASGFAWSAWVVQVMTPLAWSSALIDPAAQCTAHPIMSPLPRRRDDQQPTRACPQSRTSGPDERTIKPVLTVKEPPPYLSPPPHGCRPWRRSQGPPAATRSGSARALTPTPMSTCAPLSKTAQTEGTTA